MRVKRERSLAWGPAADQERDNPLLASVPRDGWTDARLVEEAQASAILNDVMGPYQWWDLCDGWAGTLLVARSQAKTLIRDAVEAGVLSERILIHLRPPVHTSLRSHLAGCLHAVASHLGFPSRDQQPTQQRYQEVADEVAP